MRYLKRAPVLPNASSSPSRKSIPEPLDGISLLMNIVAGLCSLLRLVEPYSHLSE